MKFACFWILLSILVSGVAYADPEHDREAFVAYFKDRFPDVPFTEFTNGIYAIDLDARAQWLAIEEFPPYEFALESGQEFWQESFPDGMTYSDCFPDAQSGVRQHYPVFDSELERVVTLDMAINLCREKHGLSHLEYGSEEILALSAHMAFLSRGNLIDIKIPTHDEQALAAYEAGKQFYYSKRGQLNLACSDCHISSVGQYVRADHLGPSLGHPTHFPVYRSKQGRMLSLHQRFLGCVRDVRAKPFALQSEPFRNLEYFLTYMSNGLPVNGPGARK